MGYFLNVTRKLLLHLTADRRHGGNAPFHVGNDMVHASRDILHPSRDVHHERGALRHFSRDHRPATGDGHPKGHDLSFFNYKINARLQYAASGGLG